jgi:hypothetical protein
MTLFFPTSCRGGVFEVAAMLTSTMVIKMGLSLGWAGRSMLCKDRQITKSCSRKEKTVPVAEDAFRAKAFAPGIAYWR